MSSLTSCSGRLREQVLVQLKHVFSFLLVPGTVVKLALVSRPAVGTPIGNPIRPSERVKWFMPGGYSPLVVDLAELDWSAIPFAKVAVGDD
jgi:hypothetical protein